MKILIISHVPITGTYGAATSIRNHINCLGAKGDHEFVCVEQFGMHYGHKVKLLMSVKRFFRLLPVVGNYDAFQSDYLRKIYYYLRRKLSYFMRGFLLDVIYDTQPDVIHINSLVLSDVISWIKSDSRINTIPLVASVREVLDANKAIRNSPDIPLIDTFVCIDLATKESVLSSFHVRLNKNKIIVQQNPFPLTSNTWSYCGRIKKEGKVVFAIAGALTEDKGVLFVIHAFLASKIPNTLLLVVGRGHGGYARKIIHICSQYNSLEYLGELPNLSETGFYRCVDVLLRGDSTFRTGRTVYEAIYAGARTILPAFRDEYLADSVLSTVLGSVMFYRPLDMESLVSTMHEAVSLVSDKNYIRPKFGDLSVVYKQSYEHIYSHA